MPNGPTHPANGNSGLTLSRQQAERLVTWGTRTILGALIALLLWNANGIITRQERQEANYAAVKDRALRLEVQVYELTRRMEEKDEQIEDLRTL